MDTPKLNTDPVRRFDLSLPHGITLACRGSGLGRTRVMLLHGFPEAAFVWDEVMARVAPQAACVAPNLRGYPGSSAPTEVSAYRPRHLVADVAAAIEALGAPLDLLVAHDWGGALAWNLAAQRPELMRRLLIVNSPHPATFLRELKHDHKQQVASAYMNFLCRPDAHLRLAEDGFRRLWPFFGDADWLTPGLREQYQDAWHNGGRGLTGPVNYYRASPLRPPLGADDALHRLELPDEAVTVRVPTTLLWGEQDKALLPGLLNGLEHWVPQLDVRRVPEASHWIVHEQPDRVAELIQSLLD
ncbi:MAG: alpha/beta fold hydrolase [Rubrivivax sp.]|nr:alpha/beta fold hydrolase [Rubrivivax sp.]MDP3614965.1 alpha/beta fold hydrolase [Rubrivivax sp.]